MSCSATDLLNFDLLHSLMEHVDSVSTLRNLKCRYAHLTNYSLNKKSRHFVSNDDPEKDDVGSKWSLRALWDYLAKKGEDVRKVRREIASVLVKTLIAAESEITPITHRAFAAKKKSIGAATVNQLNDEENALRQAAADASAKGRDSPDGRRSAKEGQEGRQAAQNKGRRGRLLALHR